ncbi:MAG TPA: cell division protein FtsZ [Gaiellaceae bacterium]|nr:cell division protein FtsZ [Gaiellaceae bacterium]
MARKRASMREGPLAELFRATEAAQRQAEGRPQAEPAHDPEPEAPPAENGFEVQPRTSEHDLAEPPPAVTEAPPAAPAPPVERAAPPAPSPPPVEERPRLDPLPEQPARLHRAPRADSAAYLAVIRIVGVGGAGLNAVDRMIDAGITGVDFIAVNTDIQQLQMCDAPTKIHIGRELTEGLGSGADPEIGRRAAEEAHDQIKRVLRGSDMVFIAAGEGGGTGSGAAPVVARIARELGALSVGIVTTPFRFEGTRRRSAADAGVESLRESCDTVIVIPNDRLLEVLEKDTSMLDAFKIADDVLRQGVQGICDLITMPGLINLDFADVRTVMSNGGNALMGIGFATGENRAREAAERALRSPLIDTELTGARGILLSIAGGDDLSLFEVNEAAEVVRQGAVDDTNLIFGATIDDRLTGQVWVTVIATGLGGERRARRPVAVPSPAREATSEDVLEPPSFLRDL